MIHDCNEHNIKLPESAQKAIDTLSIGGFSAYAVGGCVRDSLMGKKAFDYDITTSALPNQISAVFKDFKTVETGIKHGTVTVIIDGDPLEITSFRKETGYSDHRHPDKVEFTESLSEDLRRRDFTVNAMAYNPKDGLVDLFGGKKDLKSGIIRCVGNPEKRFSEDALRILRAMRFSAVLGFSIESKTSDAMKKAAPYLKYVSAERITAEFMKLICGKNASRILERYSDILGCIIPEMIPVFSCPQHCRNHRYDVWHHTLKALEISDPDPVIRLAVLFHDIGKPSVRAVDKNGYDTFHKHPEKSAEAANAIMTSMKLDNRTKSQVLWLIKHHDQILPVTNVRVKKLLRSGGPELFEKLTRVSLADNSAKTEIIGRQRKHCADDAMEVMRSVIADGECFSLKDLKINGNDLIELGFKPGKDIGRTLNFLLDLVIENKLANDSESLKDSALGILKGLMYP